MYLHICKNIIIKKDDIIGLFDIESLKKTKEYKEMYENLEKEKKLTDVSKGMQKTLIIVKRQEIKGYISNITVGTLQNRMFFR